MKFINSLTLLSDSPYAWNTSYWMQILKLQTFNYLWFLPSHYLEVADNYNKEKVIVTTKTFPLFQSQCSWIVIHNTQTAVILQKQDEHNIYVIVKTMCPPGYHHNGFAAIHAVGHMMYDLSKHSYIACQSTWVATKSLLW